MSGAGREVNLLFPNEEKVAGRPVSSTLTSKGGGGVVNKPSSSRKKQTRRLGRWGKLSTNVAQGKWANDGRSGTQEWSGGGGQGLAGGRGMGVSSFDVRKWKEYAKSGGGFSESKMSRKCDTGGSFKVIGTSASKSGSLWVGGTLNSL